MSLLLRLTQDVNIAPLISRSALRQLTRHLILCMPKLTTAPTQSPSGEFNSQNWQIPIAEIDELEFLNWREVSISVFFFISAPPLPFCNDLDHMVTSEGLDTSPSLETSASPGNELEVSHRKRGRGVLGGGGFGGVVPLFRLSECAASNNDTSRICIAILTPLIPPLWVAK